MTKRKIDVIGFSKDVKNGLSDAELMTKYEIPSQNILEGLFEKLIANSRVSKDEINSRYQKEEIEFHEIEESTKTKITIKFVLAWVFGVLFLLAGIGKLFSSFVSGIIFIVIAILLIPYSINKVESKFNFKLASNLKTIIVVILFFMGSFTDSSIQNSFSEASKREAEEKAVVLQISNITMSDIYNSISGKTDLQIKNYFKSQVKNKRVVWQGKVIDADKEMFGRNCYVDVKPKGSGLLGTARLYVSCNAAGQVTKGKTIEFDGEIENIADILGVHVYFQNPQITIFE